jgi:hypothetical protein
MTPSGTLLPTFHFGSPIGRQWTVSIGSTVAVSHQGQTHNRANLPYCEGPLVPGCHSWVRGGSGADSSRGRVLVLRWDPQRVIDSRQSVDCQSLKHQQRTWRASTWRAAMASPYPMKTSEAPLNASSTLLCASALWAENRLGRNGFKRSCSTLSTISLVTSCATAGAIVTPLCPVAT